MQTVTGFYERWPKLWSAAAACDYDWADEAAHNSLGDCRATLHVLKCWYGLAGSNDLKKRIAARQYQLKGLC